MYNWSSSENFLSLSGDIEMFYIDFMSLFEADTTFPEILDAMYCYINFMKKLMK